MKNFRNQLTDELIALRLACKANHYRKLTHGSVTSNTEMLKEYNLEPVEFTGIAKIRTVASQTEPAFFFAEPFWSFVSQLYQKLP